MARLFSISQTQGKILSSAFLQADASAKSIAQQNGVKEKTVRSTIRQFVDRGVIQPFPIVNIHALGFTDYCIFLSIASAAPKVRQRCVEWLSKQDAIAWLAETSGEFHLTVSLFCHSIFEVTDFFSRFAQDLPDISIEKQLAVRATWTSFRCKHWGQHASAISHITRGKPPHQETLDSVDHAILSELARAPLAPYAQLARKLKIPVTTFAYRIQQLRARRILLGTVFHLDAHTVGMYQSRLLVGARQPSDKCTNALWQYAAEHPYISGFVHCVGEWDYELNVEVFSPDETSAIIEDLYHRCGQYIRVVKALTITRTIKCRPFPFAHS